MVKKNENVCIYLSELFDKRAKIEESPQYIKQALELAGEGKKVELTGAAPVWLYLRIAHALHGRVKALSYNSPVTGEVVIFNHDPF